MSNASADHGSDRNLDGEFDDVHEDDVHDAVDEEASVTERPSARPLEVDDGDWVESDPRLVATDADDDRR